MTDGPDLFEMGWLNKPPVVAGVLPDQPQSSPGNLLLSILSVPLDLAFFFSSLFGLILADWLASELPYYWTDRRRMHFRNNLR